MKIPEPWYRKANQTWYVTVNGRQVNLGKDKQAANAEYKRIVRERGLNVSTDDCTLHELISAYWAWYKEEREPITVETRRHLAQGLKDFTTPTKRATDVTPHIIRTFIRKKTKSVSPSTKAKNIAFFKAMFNWGRKEKLISVDPIAAMDKPAEVVREEYLPPSKFREVILAPKIQEFQDLLTFMLDTGCRPREIVKLRADMYDAENSRFVFLIRESKGKKEKRIIYLTPTTKRIADRLVNKWPDGPIFRNSRGAPYDRHSINSSFRRLKEKLGIPELCATVLRHSFAHYRLTSGQDSATVAKLLGHKDTRMLMRRYGHLEEGDFLKEQAAAIRLPHVKANAKQ